MNNNTPPSNGKVRNILASGIFPNLTTETELDKGDTLYVVMDKYCTTVIMMPGLKKPFSTNRRKYADYVAKEKGNGAVVRTLREAIDLTMRSPCNLPPDHKLYSKDRSAPKVHKSTL